jgi:hypothetical protein
MMGLCSFVISILLIDKININFRSFEAQMTIQTTYPQADYTTPQLSNNGASFPTANYATQYSYGFSQPSPLGV